MDWTFLRAVHPPASARAHPDASPPGKAAEEKSEDSDELSPSSRHTWALVRSVAHPFPFPSALVVGHTAPMPVEVSSARKGGGEG